MKPAFYNEIDPFCAAWLRNLIKAGLIPDREVDERDIRSVEFSDLSGFHQCHFFAGIGGFGLACRLAGIPDDEEIWTGGFPCQPFSVAGRQLAQEDDRHLWPVLSRLIEQARPDVFVGENVAGIIDLALDGVLFDLESAGYASRAFVVPACAVNAPHRRDRVWIAARRMADADGVISGEEWEQRSGELLRSGEDPRACDSDVADTNGDDPQWRDARSDERNGCAYGSSRSRKPHGTDSGYSMECAPSIGRKEPESGRCGSNGPHGGFWERSEYRTGADGKARRVEPRIRLLASGLSGRMAKLRAGGNAIVPQVAAEIIKAVMAVRP